jgi:hypothetical protein
MKIVLDNIDLAVGTVIAAAVARVERLDSDISVYAAVAPTDGALNGGGTQCVDHW